MTRPRPVPGTPAPFVLPRVGDRALPGGARLRSFGGGSVPLVEIRIVLDAGSSEEPEGARWLAALAAAYLREGAGDMDAEGLAAAFARLGGSFGASSGADTSRLVATALSEHAVAAARLLGTVLRRATLPPSEEARLVADLRRERDVQAVQPGTMAASRFLGALYRDHPYGRGLPSDAEVAALRRDQAAAFWTEVLAAAPARVYVAGPCDGDAVADALAAAFDGRAVDAARPRPVADPRPVHATFLVDRPGAEQSTLYLGLPVMPAAHEDFVPFLVLNALVGGAFYSRVTRNIREDKGYAYSPRSSVAAQRGASHWVQVADVTTAVTGAAVAEIRREIARLREEPPAEEELAGIRNYLAGSHVIAHATPAGVLDHVAFLDFHGLDAAWSRRYVERIHAVTPAEVLRLARTWLDPDRMTLACAGDAASVRPQLAGLEGVAPPE